MVLHGGIITRRPLCYTTDGRLVIAPCGNDIRVHSARSGEHLATLRGHTAEVTSVAQDPSSTKLLLSSSYDGTLKQWDVQEGTVLATWNVGSPIESMVYSKAAGVAYVSVSHNEGRAGRVVPYLLPSGQVGPGAVKTSAAGRLVVSPSGLYVAAVDRHSCFVWAAGSSSRGQRAKPFNLVHTKAYTCATFDSTDSCIALGDATGRILIWHNFKQALDQWAGSAAAAVAAAGGSSGGSSGGKEQLPPVTTVHWHASAVGALCFSGDGTYLLSGGQEGALVLWARPTMKRNYLPRLGGALIGITACAADPARLCVSQSDNTIRLINTAAMRVEASIHGLRPPPPTAALLAAGYGRCCAAGASSPAGVVVQPGSSHLVLPADNAMLQFYDVCRGRHVARLQVSPRNQVVSAPSSSQAAGGQPVTPVLHPSVVLAGFTAAGHSLVTVDVRPSTEAHDTTPECTLRFWDAPSTTTSQIAGAAAPYALNTTTDDPHRGPITSLACHPTQQLAATTGANGEFRLWTRSRRSRRDDGSAVAAGDGGWYCAAVGGYRGRPLTACCFSSDGSVLAVAAGSTVTLWDHGDNSLVGSLALPREVCGAEEGGAVVRQLLFLQGSPYLVGVVGGGTRGPLLQKALQAIGIAAPAAAQQQRQQHHGTREDGTDAHRGGSDKQQQQQGNSKELSRLLRQNPAAAAVDSCWGHALVVWNVLNGSVSWYGCLPVCSVAADPASPHFAVGVPAVLPAAGGGSDGLAAGSTAGGGSNAQNAAAAAAGAPHKAHGSSQQHKAQQQWRQQQQQHSRQGLVLLFSAESADPQYACPVRGSDPSSLLFMPRSSTAAAAAAGNGNKQQPQQQQLSPLLLLTQDRRHAWLELSDAGLAATGGTQLPAAAAAAAAGVPAGTRAAMEAELAAGADESVLEAMFGKMELPAAAAAAGSSAAEAAAVKTAVRQLFDAPSHVLPAPSSLCPTLLELLIGAGQH